jgi:hypothetical protein
MLRAILFFLTCLHTLIWGGVAYVAGQQDFTPTLWIVNVATGATTTVSLENNSSPDSSAAGIAYLGNQLYIIGKHEGRATLWITSLQGALQKKLQLTAESSSAFSIIAYNNKLFVTGYQDLKSRTATLWILNRNGSIYKTTSLTLLDNYTSSQGSSLTISNNQLYITGRQRENNSDRATLWIVDTKGNSNNPIVLDDLPSQGNFIEANNNKLYITGDQTEDFTHATLWISGLDGKVESTTPLDSTTNTTYGLSLAFFNNLIYLTGNLLDGPTLLAVFRSCLWITQMDGTVDQTIQWLADPNPSLASSVKSFDNHILVSGARSRGEDLTSLDAMLWVLKPDGSLSKTIPLSSSSAQFSIAHSIYLLHQNPKTLNNAFKTFSPFKYQKGV